MNMNKSNKKETDNDGDGVGEKEKEKDTAIGGNVIASGGYGCVFSPALTCENETMRKPNTISKLMTTDHADSEYEEITKYKSKLSTIPNYSKYFMIDNIYKCKPSKLMPSDTAGFDSKCRPLIKDGITTKNINQSLDKLMLLNIPYGGVTVDEYIRSVNTNQFMSTLNVHLIDLLVNGICPMNRLNIYHGDIKESNILVLHTKTEYKTRLIDWGLSCEYTPDSGQRVPNQWKNAPLQFNAPFSIIIITETFIDKYNTYLQNGGKVNATSLRPFVQEYMKHWFEKRGIGHYNAINEIMYFLFSNEIRNTNDDKRKMLLVEAKYTLPYMVNYITDVLVHYTKYTRDGMFNIKPYIDKVFVQIIDVWGFIMSYNPLLEILHENYSTLTPKLFKLFNLLKTIFIKYLFTPHIKPINIASLVKDLEKISKILDNVPLSSRKTRMKVTIRNKSSLSLPSFIRNKTRRRLSFSGMKKKKF